MNLIIVAPLFSARRQVLWMAKQILQVGLGDAIDDWLLQKIQWLRSEEVVARGIQWVHRASFHVSLYGSQWILYVTNHQWFFILSKLHFFVGFRRKAESRNFC
jgi:hypothetical protein